MNFRTAGALTTLLLGLAGPSDHATAQYYPPPQAYPPQAYPPAQGYPPYRAAPALEEDGDGPFYDPPMVQRAPLPPPGVWQGGAGPAVDPPGANVRAGRAAPVYPEEVELLPPPPGYFYREAPPGYEPSGDANARLARPNYAVPPAGAQPGLPAPSYQDGARPPMSIGPGQVDPGPTGAIRGDTHLAALPPDVRPETGPVKELPPQFRRTQIDYRTKEPAGTLIIDTQNTYLFLVLGNGKAMRYGIGVGREGFTWAGTEKVSRMAEWPDWHPPEEMIDRQPYLPRFMAGGPGNPLGARALYLGKTVYRIHGTNQPSTIGTFVSSGCIRLTNEDVTDLYTRVKVGTRVVVLPGRPPAATAAATPIGPSGAPRPGSPQVTPAPLGQPASAMAR
jgi:lipoprotein-anchoring transpeptidase ErfK/SrfK